jgi:hypothetical protein
VSALLISIVRPNDLRVGFTTQWRIDMAKLKILAAALLATAVVSAPAMARDYHQRHRVYINSAEGPGAVYINGRSCIPAPRVGSFATAPWGNGNIPCEPYGYGSYGYNGGYAWDY